MLSGLVSSAQADCHLVQTEAGHRNIAAAWGLCWPELSLQRWFWTKPQEEALYWAQTDSAELILHLLTSKHLF